MASRGLNQLSDIQRSTYRGGLDRGRRLITASPTIEVIHILVPFLVINLRLPKMDPLTEKALNAGTVKSTLDAYLMQTKIICKKGTLRLEVYQGYRNFQQHVSCQCRGSHTSTVPPRNHPWHKGLGKQIKT